MGRRRAPLFRIRQTLVPLRALPGSWSEFLFVRRTHDTMLKVCGAAIPRLFRLDSYWSLFTADVVTIACAILVYTQTEDRNGCIMTYSPT